MWRNGDQPDLSLDGVPMHIRKRWEGKVGAAGYSVAVGTERRVRAQEIARNTGRDVGEVYDELVKQNR